MSPWNHRCLVERELDARTRKPGSKKFSGIPHLQLFGQLNQLRGAIFSIIDCNAWYELYNIYLKLMEDYALDGLISTYQTPRVFYQI